LLYLALGATTAFLNPFIVVILQQRGLDAATIGAVMAIAAVGFIAAVPVWGHVGDAILGRRQALALCVAIATAVALGIAAPVTGVVLALLVVAFNFSQGACLGLADSLAVGVLTDPRRNYGRIRMLASFSFAVAAVSVGVLYNRTGYGTASLLFAIGSLAMLVALVWTPGTGPKRSGEIAFEPGSERARGPVSAGGQAPAGGQAHGGAGVAKPATASRLGSTGIAFSVQPGLLGVLAAVALVWFAVIVSFTFLSLRIVALGGQASDVALSFGISAFAEIPGMLLAARLAARIGLRGLFTASAIGYAAAFLSWTVLNTPGAIIATRLVTGLSYGGLSVAMVLTIGEILPAYLQATGQTLYQGTATGVAAVVGNSIGGLLYGSAGFAFLFFVCAVVLVAGAAVGWLTLPKHVARVPVPAEIDEVIVGGAPLV
jgi:MFS family permease